MPSLTWRRQFLTLVPATIIGLAWIWRASWVSDGVRHFTLFDDALISMTYGRTLAQAGELVWYPGAARVEGITNPLWTLYMAVLHLTGLPSAWIALLVSVSGLVCVLGAAILAGRLAMRLPSANSWVALGSTFAVSLSYPALYWSVRGMEVGLQLVLLFAAMLLTVRVIEGTGPSGRQSVALSIVVVLATWTRLDILVLFGAMVAWLLMSAWREKQTRRVALLIAVSGLMAAAVQTVWRYTYYGSWAPNTYFLKVEGHPIVERLLRGQWTDGKLGLLLAVLALAYLVLVRRQWRDSPDARVAGLLLAPALIAIVYSTYVGGDAWDELTFGNRYVAPSYALGAMLLLSCVATMIATKWRWSTLVLPAVVGLAATAIGTRAFSRGSLQLDFEVPGVRLWVALAMVVVLIVTVALIVSMRRAAPPNEFRTARRAAPVLAVCLAVLLGGSLSWVSVVTIGGAKVPADQRYAEFGRALNGVLPSDTRLAVVWAGAPAYYSGLPVIDLLGKSDPVIARSAPALGFKPGHDKFDYSYSVGKLRPDAIAELFMPTPEVEAYVREQGYRLCSVPAPRHPDGQVQLWIRQDAPAFGQAVSCA